MNGDGKLDAITANSASNNVSVLTGNGAGIFTAVASSPLAMGNAPNHVIAVDLDNDGKLDLVTANTGAVLTGGMGVNVRKGDGAGSFSGVVFTALTAAPTNLVSADFNLDGNADVAVSHSTAQFTYLTGKGAIGTAPFNAAVSAAVGTQASSILAAPFHSASDGLYDVVTTSSNTNNLSITLNLCQ